uniref:ribosomal protein S3 n=1 Tax=Odontella aurita TaxID=265563 RepID=UPI00202850ED|nr:ribosomal protein S3 [Odontella aurita]QYB22957.1 ribosomal protein S3 [Odontella aurita]
MGQKTNSNLLRLNIEKSNWKSKYYAKTSEESTLYIFKDLDIKNYINRVFNIYGVIVKNHKLYYSHSLLKLFISFFLTKKYFKVCKKVKRVCSKEFNFSEHLLESLSLFLKKKLSVFIIFQTLNKNYSVRIKNDKLQLLKQAFIKLRKFAKTDFFIETINILIITLKKTDSSKLLSELLAFQLKVLKKQTFFLITIKQILITFLKAKIFSTKGIKIVIKGRLNGAPRARKTTILLGNISAQTFKSNINYNTNTSFTRNGTFGIKVWIQEVIKFIYIQICFYNPSDLNLKKFKKAN